MVRRLEDVVEALREEGEAEAAAELQRALTAGDSRQVLACRAMLESGELQTSRARLVTHCDWRLPDGRLVRPVC